MGFRNRIALRVPAMLLAAVAVAASGASYAEAGKVTVDVAAGKKIFLEGKDDVSPCQSCHGPKALGIDEQQTPRLAGIGYAYIVKQLTNFANDERINVLMNVMQIPNFHQVVSLCKWNQ